MECASCGADPCGWPSFCKVCRKADRNRFAGKPPTQAGGNWWPVTEIVPHEAQRLRQLRDGTSSLDQLYRAINDRRGRPAPATTVEAFAYQLRAGVDALRDQAALVRIAELDERQIKEIAQRLTKWRWGKSKNNETPPKVPPWKPFEIEALIEIWRISRGRD
jgi:hypothetical protein